MLPPPPLRPPNQLLIHRPRERRAHRLPCDPQPQPIKEAPRPILHEHLPRRMQHIPVPLRHQLYARLDRIKRVRRRRREPRRRDPRRKIDPRRRARREARRAGPRSRLLEARGEPRKPPLRLLVEDDVEPRVGCVAHGGRAEAREEAADALALEDAPRGQPHGVVGVQVALEAHLEDGDGHHEEAGPRACCGAGGQVRRVAQLGQRARVAVGCGAASRASGGAQCGELDAAPQRVEAREVDGGAASCAECAGECAAPELADGVWAARYGLDGGEEGVLVGLLQAGFEEVGGLEEDGGEDA